MSFQNIGIIGAGGWGTALGIVLGLQGKRVLLWGNDSSHVQDLIETRVNAPYLPGVRLPDSIIPTAELGALSECDLVLIVTPSKAIRAVSERLAECPPA